MATTTREVSIALTDLTCVEFRMTGGVGMVVKLNGRPALLELSRENYANLRSAVSCSEALIEQKED